MLPPRPAALAAPARGPARGLVASLLALPLVALAQAPAAVVARPAPTPLPAATAPAAAAVPGRLVGDAARGRLRANTCMGCHGIPHYTNAYPTYRVPMLGGQNPEYIVAALKEYQAGERWHPTMHAQASSMSDQDMADLAAFLSKAPRHR